MPTSDFNQIGRVLGFCVRLKPRSVLDVGMGFGKYGVLLREYLEVQEGRFNKEHWRVTIAGIEVFPAYENPIWHVAYDWFKVGDANALVPELPPFDLILLVDVIEHFEKDRGRALLNACMEKGKFVLVATPDPLGAQGEAFGNPAEKHRAQWNPVDFRPFCKIARRERGQAIYLLSKREELPISFRGHKGWTGSVLEHLRDATWAVLPVSICGKIQAAAKRLLGPPGS
jgi:hypothetical protein